jgi:hypothetical protein
VASVAFAPLRIVVTARALLQGRCPSSTPAGLAHRHHREVTEPALDLDAELRAHMAEPFPASVERGEEYGEVDAVMIGADIYGWADGIRHGGALSAVDRSRLRQAADELQRSLASFPADARPYYERVLRIARLALGRG